MNTQHTETPKEFVDALERFLHIKFKYDMAGNGMNKKAPIVYSEAEDSLSIDWPRDGWCFLNPPFKNLSKWIPKVSKEKDKGSKIVTLWPLSGDLNQIPSFKESQVYVIHGRIWPLVRACMVCVWMDGFYDEKVQGLRWEKGQLTKLWG